MYDSGLTKPEFTKLFVARGDVSIVALSITLIGLLSVAVSFGGAIACRCARIDY